MFTFDLASSQPVASYATVYVYAGKFESLVPCPLNIRLGSKITFEIRSREAVAYHVAAQKGYPISGSTSCDGAQSDITLNLEAGKEYFIRASMSGNNIVKATDESSLAKVTDKASVKVMNEGEVLSGEIDEKPTAKELEVKGKNYSIIYFSRGKGFAGAACSVRVKVGNQDFFNLNNGNTVEYKIYSTGMVGIGGLISCDGRGCDLNLEVENGKVYYVKADVVKFGRFLTADVRASYERHLDSALLLHREEDIRMPINSNALDNAQKGERVQGTCFLISPGYLVTNFHCVDGAKEITVKGIDGDFTTKYGASVVATDPSNDLALLRIGNKNLKFLPLPAAIGSTGIAQGQKVYALGFPAAKIMGEEVKITEGIISSKSGAGGDISKYQISAAVNHGNSGGPLIDEQGNLVGVIYAKSTIAESAGYAIKGSYLEAFLKNIDGFEYPNLSNTMKDTSFTDKVALWKKYIFIVETN